MENMDKVFLIVAIILLVIGLIWGAPTQIEWTVYLGIPLVVLFGAAGITFISERIEAVILGLLFAAFWPVLWEAIQSAFSTLQ